MTDKPSCQPKKLLLSTAAALFWLAVWQAAAMLIGKEYLLPSPLSVLKALWQLIPRAAFLASLSGSALRIGLGFLLAFLGGILFAVPAAASPTVQALLSPLMRFFRSVPVASFVVLAIIWFGSKGLATAISFTVAVPLFYFSVLAGIRSADSSLLELAKVFRVRKLRTAAKIYVPAIVKELLTVSRTAVGMCWKAGVAAELIGTPARSIGENLYLAKLNFNTADLFAWTAAMIVVCALCEKLVLFILRKAGEVIAA